MYVFERKFRAKKRRKNCRKGGWSTLQKGADQIGGDFEKGVRTIGKL